MGAADSPAPGGRLRINVQLVNALDGKQIENERIEQSPDKILELQDSLAHEVSLFLRKRVGQEIDALNSRVGTRNPAAWDALQRARQTIGEVETLVSSGDLPSAVQKIAQADSALQRVEALDKNWQQPVVERAFLAFRTARLYERTDPELAKAIETGLGHADRALKLAPNDAGALEARGSLRYWKWLNNLAPDAEAAALLNSAEQDLRAATTANDRAATAWNARRKSSRAMPAGRGWMDPWIKRPVRFRRWAAPAIFRPSLSRSNFSAPRKH